METIIYLLEILLLSLVSFPFVYRVSKELASGSEAGQVSNQHEINLAVERRDMLEAQGKPETEWPQIPEEILNEHAGQNDGFSGPLGAYKIVRKLANLTRVKNFEEGVSCPYCVSFLAGLLTSLVFSNLSSLSLSQGLISGLMAGGMTVMHLDYLSSSNAIKEFFNE